MSIIDRISRRRFLTNATGFTLALPFLPSIMLSRTSRAQTAAPAPRRFISVFTSNGQRVRNWLPQDGAEQAWRVLDAANNVRDFPLAALPSASGISRVLHPDLNTVLDKLLLIRGLDMTNVDQNHKPSMMLSAWNDSALHTTIDNILANSPKVYSSPPKVRNLVVAMKEGYQSYTPFSIDKSGNMVPPIFDPAQVFDLLFGGTTTSNPALLLTRRQLVIDRVREEFVALRSSSLLSSEDRLRLDDHAAKLADLETRLTTIRATGCSTPVRPTSVAQASISVSNLKQVTKDHLDLIVLAIKCDLTRVVSINLCPGTDLRPVSFFSGNSADAVDHHSLSHSVACCDSANIPHYLDQIAAVNNWYAKQLAYLLNQLNGEVEPGTGRTYLDNSLVYWGNEDGTGHGNDVHTPFGMPVLLAGSAGAQLDTGRYVDYRTPGVKRQYGTPPSTATYPGIDDIGRPYNLLLTTILDAFGLTPADYEQGTVGYGTYVDSLSQYTRYTDSDAKRRSVLPFLKKG